MNDYAWIMDLKKGDKVILVNSYGNSVAKVDSLTKTLLIVGNHKFYRKNGNEHGRRTWVCSTFLKRYTIDEGIAIEEAATVMRLTMELDRTDWNKYSLESLFKITDAIKAEDTK